MIKIDRITTQIIEMKEEKLTLGQITMKISSIMMKIKIICRFRIARKALI